MSPYALRPSASSTQSATRLRRAVLAAVACGLSLVAAGSAFADVLAGWDVHGQTGWGTSPLPATISGANVAVGGLTRGGGVGTGGTAAARAWGGTAWNVADAAAAVSANKFATFTVTANAGYQVSYSSISRFDYRRSSTGATSGVVQYQIGSGAFTDIATVSYSSTSSSGASLSAIDLSAIGALQNVPAGTAVTFRVVNYGASGSTGTWYVFDTANTTANDLEISGTVTAASATDGTCGTDDGQILAATAPSNLCTAGTPSAIAGTGHPWTWDCAGTGGGATASCSADIQTYTLTFATDGNGTLTGTTPQVIDHGGSAAAVTANPNGGYTFVNWTGTGGFVATAANPLTVANVTTAQTVTANFSSAPINGACGSANGQARATAPTSGLCAVGGSSAVAGTGPWTWSCSGINGGSPAACSASLDTSAHFHDFAPVADAQVVEGTPTVNSGTGTSMYVASANGGTFLNERIWTAFNLSGELPPGATVTSAKLRLYMFKADNEGDALPVNVHTSDDDGWTETGITWATQPAFDSSPLASYTLGADDEYSWIEFDVTAHVQDHLNLGDNRINLMLKAATEGASQWASYAVDTKEFNTGYAPRLRVEYSGGAWADDKINIIHVNDIHSRLTTHDLDFPDGSGESPAFEEAGGAAHMAAKIMELKAANPNSLVLDAGDISEGNPLGDLRVNGGMVDYLGTLDAQLKTLGGRGLDAVVIGNHDVRDAQMLTNMQNSGLPFIAVNMLNYGAAVPAPSAWPAANPFRPYVIINTISSAGTPTRVAVLGYLTDDSAILGSSTETLISVKETRWTSTNANHVKLKDWVDYLRNTEGADVVVLLSHIGHRRLNSGAEILLGDGDVAPPDLVAAGHWHTWGKTVWQPSNLNHNVAVVEAASYGQYVGEVQLTPKGEYLDAQKHPVKAAAIVPNSAVDSLVNTLITEYDAQTDKPCVLPPAVTGRANASQSCPLFHVVGHSAVDLKLDKDKWFTLSEFPWSGDNAAGEWIADATVWKLNQTGVAAQLALQSGGGVRRDVKAGPVTYLDIYETYPWTDDQIVVVTLTSADVWNYLESHYVGSSISAGWQVTADDGEITAITYNGVPLSKGDTGTTWQVAISQYMFLHDDWISESGANFDFSSKPNTAYTQSIRDSVVEYTAQFTAANPMTISGPRYVLNTELAGGFRAVVTMVADAESEPYFEGVFVRLVEALPETLARRTGYGLASLVNTDGSINSNHEFAETMLYRSHLGFPDGVLKVGDIIEVWGEGGFFSGNPQLVDQESVYAPGKEFSVLGHDANLAQPEFQPNTAAFFDEAHENRLVKFRALRTGDKTVQDAEGTSITVYKEGGYYTFGKLPGSNGDLLELTGIQTQRTGSSPERRFRLREATVVPSGGAGSGYLPFSTVNAITPNPVTSGPITLTAAANDAATGGSGTLSLTPVADTQVASGYPTYTYGSATSMYLQSAASGYGNERAWLRFDLTGLPSGAAVSAARLKLYQWRPASTALPVAVHGSSDTSWSEATMNWGTQPSFDASALDTQTVSAANTWYTWNLGSYANGKTAVSFVAKPATEDASPASANYAFDAKEFGSYTPALEVDYTAPLSSAGVVSVQFFYRYAADGLNWGAWTAAGTDSNAADGWQMSFALPEGAGHYEFYSVATDNDGNVQPAPIVAHAAVQFASGLQAQTIGFDAPADQILGSGTAALTATASSGLPVSFSSLTLGVCDVSGNTVTLLAAGTCSIAADQPGNASYEAAPQVVRSFAVKIAQAISFAALIDRDINDGSFGLAATSSSGYVVLFSSATPTVCSVAGSSVTLLTAGTCSIAADQPGDAIYAPAATVVQGFNVTGILVGGEDGDVPIPLWALALLGAGLLGVSSRRASVRS